jgi:hypothetical protein
MSPVTNSRILEYCLWGAIHPLSIAPPRVVSCNRRIFPVNTDVRILPSKIDSISLYRTAESSKFQMVHLCYPEDLQGDTLGARTDPDLLHR